MQAIEFWIEAVARIFGPGTFRRALRRPVVGRTDEHARFLISLANGRQCQSASAGGGGRARAFDEAHFNQLMQSAGDIHLAIGRINAPAGKHIAAGHKNMGFVAPAHQHFGFSTRAINNDHCRSRDGANGGMSRARRRFGASKACKSRFGRSLAQAAALLSRGCTVSKPCMRKAH